MNTNENPLEFLPFKAILSLQRNNSPNKMFYNNNYPQLSKRERERIDYFVLGSTPSVLISLDFTKYRRHTRIKCIKNIPKVLSSLDTMALSVKIAYAATE